jgi:hypothetical protein
LVQQQEPLKLWSVPDYSSRSDPDPTIRTMELMERVIVQIESKLEIRIRGIEKAITLQHDDLVRVPTEVQKATSALRELLESKIEKLSEVTEEHFKSIQAQFTMLKEAATQLELVNNAAVAKSEAATSEAIKVLTTTISAANSAINDRINDLKGRLDRGEGKTSVTDPAIGSALSELSQGIKALSETRRSWWR